MKNKLHFPINWEDPMNGIFAFFREKGELGRNVMTYSSSLRYDSSPVDDLFQNNPNNFFVSNGKLYDSFEFSIVNYDLYISGYGMMGYYNDDNAQRNWNLSCIKSYGVVTISEEINNPEMCDNISDESQKCGKSDKKAFQSQNPMKCNRIRYTITGLDSSQYQTYIVLSGFEIFGYLSHPSNQTLNLCHSFTINKLFLIIIIL